MKAQLPEAAHSRLRSYAVTLLLFTVALVLILLVLPLMEQAVLLLFLGTIVISSRLGAQGPGLLATLLSIVSCAYLFFFPQSLKAGMSTGSARSDTSAFVVVVIVAALINWTTITRAGRGGAA